MKLIDTNYSRNLVKKMIPSQGHIVYSKEPCEGYSRTLTRFSWPPSEGYYRLDKPIRLIKFSTRAIFRKLV